MPYLLRVFQMSWFLIAASLVLQTQEIHESVIVRSSPGMNTIIQRREESRKIVEATKANIDKLKKMSEIDRNILDARKGLITAQNELSSLIKLKKKSGSSRQSAMIKNQILKKEKELKIAQERLDLFLINKEFDEREKKLTVNVNSDNNPSKAILSNPKSENAQKIPMK